MIIQESVEKTYVRYKILFVIFLLQIIMSTKLNSVLILGLPSPNLKVDGLILM